MANVLAKNISKPGIALKCVSLSVLKLFLMPILSVNKMSCIIIYIFLTMLSNRPHVRISLSFKIASIVRFTVFDDDGDDDDDDCIYLDKSKFGQP